jgi:hypothetical protein
VLKSSIVKFTWIWAIVFVPIETYISFSNAHPSVSGYVVNVVGVGLTLWGAVSLRKGRPYAEGVLATGWGWTTAVFWRATNLRFWFASQGQTLSFGSIELWFAPLFTVMAGAALVGSLVLLVRGRQSSDV